MNPPMRNGYALGIALAPLMLLLPAAALFNTTVLEALSPDGELVYQTEMRVRGLGLVMLVVGLSSVVVYAALGRSLGRWLDVRPRLTGFGFALSAMFVLVILAESALTFFVKTQGATLGIGYSDSVVGYRGAPTRMRLAAGNSLRGRTVEEALPHLTKFDGHRIVFMGDSVVEGEGVEPDETIPFALGRALGAGHEVINAGVSGYGFDNYAYYLPIVLQLLPDEVIVGVCLNDLSYVHGQRLVDPDAELSPLMPVTGFNRLRWGIRAHSTLLRVNNLFSNRLVPKNVEEAANWIEEDIQALVTDTSKRATHARFVRSYLAAMKAQADASGVKLRGVVFPFRYQFDGDRDRVLQATIVAEFERVGVPVVDLYEGVARGAEAAGVPVADLFFDYDHFDARGAEVVADVMKATMF